MKADKLLFIAGLSVVLIFPGYFGLIELQDEQHYGYMMTGGYFLQVIFWIIYFYKTRWKKSTAARG